MIWWWGNKAGDPIMATSSLEEAGHCVSGKVECCHTTLTLFSLKSVAGGRQGQRNIYLFLLPYIYGRQRHFTVKREYNY